MKRWFSTAAPSFLNFIPQPTSKSHPHLLKVGEIIPGTNANHYRARIEKLAALLPANSTAIIAGYQTKFATQNIFYPFQQNNNILYLTGFNEPDCCLMIHRSNEGTSTSFFTVKNSLESMLWSGPVAGIEGAKEIFGLQNVYGIEELPNAVAALKGNTIYADFEASHCGNKALAALQNTKPLAPLLQQLRLVKQPEEIALMRQSGKISSESFTETIKFAIKDAKSEAEVAAFFEFQCKRRNAERLAYVPVVAGGNRGLVLHYTHNNQLLPKADGALLMDAGALYFGYCSDITRTFPLSGRFSPAQRAIYEAVLRVQRGCIEALQKNPGKLGFGVLNDLAMHFTAIELDRLHFKRIERNIGRWFPHSIGHHLGLDLHDCPLLSRYEAKFESGNVITVEPGIYIPDDDLDAPAEYRGVAERIEDDVLLTSQGVEMLTSVPTEEFLN